MEVALKVYDPVRKGDLIFRTAEIDAELEK